MKLRAIYFDCSEFHWWHVWNFEADNERLAEHSGCWKAKYIYFLWWEFQFEVKFK